LISSLESEYDEGVPVEVAVEQAKKHGMDEQTAEHEIENLKQKGKVYEPVTDHLRST
jgi:replicative DNA helicase Mcm